MALGFQAKGNTKVLLLLAWSLAMCYTWGPAGFVGESVLLCALSSCGGSSKLALESGLVWTRRTERSFH